MASLVKAICPDTLGWAELAVLTGRKPTSGYMRAARRQLVEGGLVHIEGDQVAARDALLQREDVAPGHWPDPDEILARWTLKGPAHEIVRSLMIEGPASRAAIGDRLGRSATSGHFRSGVKDLLAAGLVSDVDRELRPHPLLELAND